MEAVANGAVGLFGQGFGYLQSNLARRRAQREAVALIEADTHEADDGGPTHGLTEAQLRALIAQDLRSFVRRPLTQSPAANSAHPFLLDRLVVSGR